jgi:hypothetical protein
MMHSADPPDRWLEALLAFYEQHRRCGKVACERHVDCIELRCSCGGVVIQRLPPLADKTGA